MSLLLFALSVAAISLTLIVSPFRNSAIDKFSRSIPAHLESPMILMPRPLEEPILSRKDFWILKSYKKAFDSLRRFNRDRYDQLLKGRQGLLDSLNYLLGANHY